MSSSRYPWLCLPLACLAPACTQNVNCVFIDGCTGGPGPIADNEAVLPVDGEWILDGPPGVDAVFPSGAQSPGSTPVVVVFSESMAPDTLARALEIVPLLASGQPGPPVVGVLEELVSDGRVLVLLPPVDLTAGQYLVRLGQDAVVTDLTGQELDAAAGAQLGTFTVAAVPPTVPRLVTTFPEDGASRQSETTLIVAVFDRPVLESSVTPLSFDVRVGGVDPAEDPAAEPLRVSATGLTDARCFLYRSQDGDGVAAPLGTSATVELRLSPAASPITERDGGVLAAATIEFTTLAFSPPLSASLLSTPNDAIGLANLTDGDPEELEVEVELDAAETNDSVDLFLFGTQKTTQPDPPLIALQRALRLTAATPIQTATFTREDVAMQLSDAPDDVRFEDGSVTFAFRLRRGSVVTPVRVLDLEPDPDTIQDPQLDTVRPEIDELAGGDTDAFRSDLRNLGLAGQADGRLRSAAVTTPLGNNGSQEVVGSGDDGAFLAAPVSLGVVAGGSTTFQLTARDEALNSSDPLDGTFAQVGVLGPSTWTPGASVEVEVFDSGTLRPLAGALVLVHSDQGNGVDFPFVQGGPTLADGKVTLPTAGAPSVAAIVTVVTAGYDLFTLHGVPVTHLSVPLHPSIEAPARATGELHTSDAAAVALLPNLDRRFDDSRRPPDLPRAFEGGACDVILGVLSCPYGPQSILQDRLGARSFFAGDFSQTEGAFGPAQLLQAFALSVPFLPADPGAFQVGGLELDFLLLDASTPPAEAAQATPAFTFHVDPAAGVNLANLFDDPDTTGAPVVSVDVLVPGLPASLAVSAGLAFDQGAERWTIRAAMPGAITAGGSLGSRGAVDTDPFVRTEVRDLDGNAAGVRPRVSTLVAAGPTPLLEALPVPAQLAPLADAETGAQAFDLRLVQAIDDSRTEGGLYRVDMNDATGRGWTLWRFDAAGTGDVVIRVVDVADGGGVGLADGALASTASAWAWSGLAPADFLWTDVEREFELFSRARTVDFFKPVRPPQPRRHAPGLSSKSGARDR